MRSAAGSSTPRWRGAASALLGFALAAGLGGCKASTQLQGRLAGLEDLADQAERNGALRCSPRELALTRAYIEFAELALAQGSTATARRFLVQAELNADAAHLQSPPQYCTDQEVVVVPVAAPAPGDADGDGFLDPEDSCPAAAELFNGFEDIDGCPDDPDTDGDGLRDSVDACVLLPEDADSYLDEDGCPEPDNDLDTIADADDRCPLEGEDPDGFEDADGCPEPDNDGDSVLDATDECPGTPGQSQTPPLGCPIKPALVVVTDCEVKITEQIHFDSRKDVIKRESFPVLDAVVDVLEKNPAIKLEIQGHTDDIGTNKYNQDLSDRRAASVRKYLVSHGIAPDRLKSKGYGEESPIVPNDSTSNRSLNRRVQFMRTEGTKAECAAGEANSTANSAK